MIEKSSIEVLIFSPPDDVKFLEYRAYVEEFISDGEEIIPSAAYKPQLSFNDWLCKCQNDSKGLKLKPGRVPASLYFLVQKSNGKILGAVHIRHNLNERLSKVGGNIGYGVRPSERRKGYATLMLRFGIERCKELGLAKALVTCNSRNAASEATIRKCGGVFEKEAIDPDDNSKRIKRFWIPL